MLKQIYVRLAQMAPLLVPNGSSMYSVSAASRPHGYVRWLASLGAIHHLDRMIALDIPWWNVAATQDIEAFLRQRIKARVFEYGSGASTVWLSRRAASVTSVEHDAAWADKLGESIAGFPSTQLITASFDAVGSAPDQPYVRAIDGTGLYDLIVIDGRLRAACLERALPHLRADGIIVFDDSGRRRYRAALAASALNERHYFGLSYCVPYPDHTSVLRRAR